MRKPIFQISPDIGQIIGQAGSDRIIMIGFERIIDFPIEIIDAEFALQAGEHVRPLVVADFTINVLIGCFEFRQSQCAMVQQRQNFADTSNEVFG